VNGTGLVLIFPAILGFNTCKSTILLGENANYLGEWQYFEGKNLIRA